MIIEQTETENEIVEQTTSVTKIKCDVCGHAVPESEWDGHDFSVNPDIDREFYTISEVDDLFDAYHTEIPRHVVDDGYVGYEMNFDVPRKDMLEVLAEEVPIAKELNRDSTQTRIAKAGLKEEYSKMLGTNKFYLLDDSIHHFMYRLSIEASTDDHKHVCDECYDVIFD
jgi:hypothetical protein